MRADPTRQPDIQAARPRTHGLSYSLRILFLRQESPGRVYQGGDLDNRLTTLLDAMSLPPHENQIENDPDPEFTDPIMCLLEDDKLLTGLSVTSERLLSRPDASRHRVHVTIEVDVGVTHSRMYNHGFLGS